MEEEYFTRAEMKKIAVQHLKEMGVYKPYIKGFEKEDEVCMFERFAGYWLSQYPELMDKKKEIEEKFGCVVYAVTHHYIEDMECYSYLMVSKYKEEVEYDFEKADTQLYNVLAYAYNKPYLEFSEMGTIGVQCAVGGITRVY